MCRSVVWILSGISGQASHYSALNFHSLNMNKWNDVTETLLNFASWTQTEYPDHWFDCLTTGQFLIILHSRLFPQSASIYNSTSICTMVIFPIKTFLKFSKWWSFFAINQPFKNTHAGSENERKRSIYKRKVRKVGVRPMHMQVRVFNESSANKSES